MIYNAYLIYKYYNYIYYIFIMYHGIKISYDSYNLVKYVYNIIPVYNINTEDNGIMLYEFEDKNGWSHLDLI